MAETWKAFLQVPFKVRGSVLQDKVNAWANKLGSYCRDSQYALASYRLREMVFYHKGEVKQFFRKEKKDFCTDSKAK